MEWAKSDDGLSLLEGLSVMMLLNLALALSLALEGRLPQQSILKLETRLSLIWGLSYACAENDDKITLSVSR